MTSRGKIGHQSSDDINLQFTRVLCETIDRGIGTDDLSSCGAEIHKQLLNALLDYTCYADVPLHQRLNPYDDPYVGAVLTTHDGTVIGTHRKEGSQERHAEPNAIAAALSTLSANSSQDATNLLLKINQAYENRIWLQSANQRDQFERLFQDAGGLIRQVTGAKKLLLYSTLEPCRDYETQPSCACLICATGIDHVYYASDDTNEKGRGRTILQTGLDPNNRTITTKPPRVFANISPERAVEINNLFFTTVHLADILFKSVTLSERALDSAYATFRLDERYFELKYIRDRLSLSFRPTLAFQINNYTPQHLRSSSEKTPHTLGLSDDTINELKKAQVDINSVILLRDATATDVARILVDRTHYEAPLPGVIISTRSIGWAEQPSLQQVLKAKGVQLYENAFRKRDEFAEGYRNVLTTRIRTELQDHIYCLVKRRDDADINGDASTTELDVYLSTSGTPDQCKYFLNSKKDLFSACLSP